VRCLTVLSNNRLASGSYDTTIKIWDLNTFTCIRTLNEHTDWIRCLKTLSNSRLASGSTDKSIKIWNLDDYSLINTLEGHTRHVKCLEYQIIK
jgi:F-box and WD-40 domain protein MET30